MGSSIGLSHCSGNADRNAQQATGGAAGSASFATGGLQLGVGGDATAQGGAATNLGGEAGAPDVNSIQQWSCENRCTRVAVDGTSYRALLVDAASCRLDRTRPKTAADCAPNEWFQCELGVYEGEPVSVSCTCSAMTDSGCICANADTVSCEAHDKLCACAVTGILVK